MRRWRAPRASELGVGKQASYSCLLGVGLTYPFQYFRVQTYMYPSDRPLYPVRSFSRHFTHSGWGGRSAIRKGGRGRGGGAHILSVGTELVGRWGQGQGTCHLDSHNGRRGRNQEECLCGAHGDKRVSLGGSVPASAATSGEI